MMPEAAAARSTNRATLEWATAGASAESIRASRASFRPSVVMARALSSLGSTPPLRMRSYRATSSCWSFCCSSDIGQATTCALPPASLGRGRFSISAVWTSANDRNICWSSGRLTNFEKQDTIGFRRAAA